MASRLTWLFLLSIVLTLLSNNFVRADDDDDVVADETVADETYDDAEEEFDDDENAISSGDVTVTTIFPGNEGKKFTLGQPITLLALFSNNGEKTFNVSTIFAHLHSPFDYNYYIQNFTVKTAIAVVGPNSQVSLEYTFKPDITLEALEFGFSAVVAYNRTDGRLFRHTLFNSTIELVEAESGSSKLVMYVAVLGGLGALAFLFTKSKVGKKAIKKVEKATDSGASKAASWDEVEVYKPKSTASAARKGKSKKA